VAAALPLRVAAKAKNLTHTMADDSSLSLGTEDFAARSAIALRDLEERARMALANNRQLVTRLEAEIAGQLETIAATVASERAAGSQHAADISQLRSELERLAAEYDAAKADWSLERDALEANRDELSGQTAKLEADQRKARDEWARQLTEFEKKLREQQADWNAQRTEWAATRALLETDRDALQQKFELALGDVNRYRGRVVELEQELARRPEATETDSAELVALRAERDALAERVEQLDKQPPVQIDPNAEQQLADLQRRFELAVEDVRELKTKNAKLESQLASGGIASAAGAKDADGTDWESQKRRLLASLEDEGDADDEPARQEERVRISSTIEMTDAIVAEKDAEIAELRSQLANSGATAGPIDEAHHQKVNELLDADVVIAEHRQRISQLERDMEATLRAAELELSLERAKIARERVELDELRAELDSLRQELCPNGMPAPGAPRRRWLSKLGLSGDES
jgi:chromosome segregation ATPase